MNTNPLEPQDIKNTVPEYIQPGDPAGRLEQLAPIVGLPVAVVMGTRSPTMIRYKAGTKGPLLGK